MLSIIEIILTNSFVQQLQPILEGNLREQTGLQALKARPRWSEAVRVLEELKGEKWESFVNRYGDWGRDLALYLGRHRCGLS